MKENLDKLMAWLQSTAKQVAESTKQWKAAADKRIAEHKAKRQASRLAAAELSEEKQTQTEKPEAQQLDEKTHRRFTWHLAFVLVMGFLATAFFVLSIIKGCEHSKEKAALEQRIKEAKEQRKLMPVDLSKNKLQENEEFFVEPIIYETKKPEPVDTVKKDSAAQIVPQEVLNEDIPAENVTPPASEKTAPAPEKTTPAPQETAPQASETIIENLE